ncbi:helix-hairpin-helix domain-containing protein [Segetibacter sp. 3557_3]|uniref:ComEA family DNA-binding protein n=1 Tax=Segetibacter sp. 3557_3 TaxID=2547429 RepID=UPI0010586D3E|nr:helix-hairpin-helix domain-containing protein [Segetibacter sp. 3557_3]TDH21306.1 helix-hairpin-helix domain-containing protein [Segetibacter sp. 3557_3]
MKKQVFLIGLLHASLCVIAQVEEALPPVKVEQQFENLAEQTEVEAEDDTYLQSLVQFRRNPIDINTADPATLKELLVLTDLQIQQLVKYRLLLGKFISLYELQAVPSWDPETIRKVLPYVMIGNPVSAKADLKDRLSSGQHTMLSRVQQVLEKSEGYLRPDSITNRYLGSRQRILLRYKYVYRNLLQYGFTIDKDAGERLISKGQPGGLDFTSFHVFARNMGLVKALALGDYTINMGQGLIHWQSLAFKKSAEVLAVKRQAEVIRPYNAASEINFHRGAALTLAGKHLAFTTFISSRLLDGNLQPEPSAINDGYISSLVTTGYHRTPSELADRNTLRETALGGNLSFNRTAFHLGANWIQYHFSKPFKRELQPYNQFAIQGDRWLNYSIDYSYTHRNLHLFGEAAADKRKNVAVVQGLLLSLNARVDASLVYRNLPAKFQSINGNAFTEATLPSNESGMYAGLAVRPVKHVRLDVYADLFKFPWLRFRVDAPSTGSDYLVQLTYKPNKLVELSARFRSENKAMNIYGLAQPTRPVVNRVRQNWRTHFSYKAGHITLRSRIDVVSFKAPLNAIAEQGFATYVDVSYKPPLKPIGLGGRLQYFETDGFESRIYSFESDVLYSFSIPFFSGKGMRYYVNINYDINKKVTCWFRFAKTLYRDQSAIGSGLDEIPGNKKSEVKLQVLYVLGKGAG